MFTLSMEDTMRLDEYLVHNTDTGEKEIVMGMHEACDIAWEMYQDPETYYVYVEDCLGHTVLEYA